MGVLDGKTSGYFLTSVASGYFRFISSYVLTSDVGNWSSGPKPPSQVSADISISCRKSTSGLNSVSGSTFIPRPPRARDRVTMAEDGPAPGRVTAGVGSVSRGAGMEPNSPDRSVRPTLRFGSESIFITGNFVKLLINLGKVEQTAEARM